MLNYIGEVLKGIREKSGDTVVNMAEKLGVSRGFLLAVANGKKKCPDSWFEKIPQIYSLDESETKNWIGTIILANHRIDFLYEKLNDENKDLVMTFANVVDCLTNKQKEAIRKILNFE